MTDARASAVGAPWLGTLQADWPLVPLRYLVSFLSGGTPDKGNPQFWTGGTIPWVSPKDMKIDRIDDAEDHITESALDWSATQLVPVGSVLVVVRGMILAHTLPVAVTTGPVAINQDIKALVCGPRLLPDFLHAVLTGQADWLLSLADSSAHGTKKLETEALQRFEVPCPPLEVQKSIIATLRAEANVFDALIAARRRVLDLIAEKRRTIIATATTHGLDPEARLRNTGVPCLGEIPAHWSAMRVRHFISALEQGWSPEAENREPMLDECGVLKLNAVDRGSFDSKAAKALPPSMDPRPELEVQPGDVLITRANTPSLVGDACFVADTRPRLMLCDLIYRLRLAPEPIDVRFLVHFLVTAGRRHPEMMARGTSNSMVKLAQEHIKDWWVPVPPRSEQEAIVDHIARETATLDAARTATERTIVLLKERRTALIAAAVRGQLDTGQARPGDSVVAPRTVIRQRTAQEEMKA